MSRSCPGSRETLYLRDPGVSLDFCTRVCGVLGLCPLPGLWGLGTLSPPGSMGSWGTCPLSGLWGFGASVSSRVHGVLERLWGRRGEHPGGVRVLE